jgi:hypothetical protein
MPWWDDDGSARPRKPKLRDGVEQSGNKKERPEKFVAAILWASIAITNNEAYNSKGLN